MPVKKQQAQQAAEPAKLDETIPGGCYIVNGVVVDANGKSLEGWSVDSNGNAVAPVVATPAPADNPPSEGN